MANGLGNFAARVSTLASKEIEISGKISEEVKEKIDEVKKTVEQKIGEFKFNEALASIWELIQFGDRYVNDNKPWEKSLDLKTKNNILFNLISILKETGNLLMSYLPKTSEIILQSIKEEGDIFKVGRIQNLFPRIEKEK